MPDSSLLIAMPTVPRCGSSMIAGVLHNLGVNMGERLNPPAPTNPKGFFEDVEFYYLHNLLIGEWTEPQPQLEKHASPYKLLVNKRYASRLRWGIKDGRLIFCWPLLKESVGDRRAKVVVIHRYIEESIASLTKMTSWGEEKSGRIVRLYAEEQQRLLRANKWPVLELNYDTVIKRPESAVRQLVEFSEVPFNEGAIEFIDPCLKHYTLAGG